MSSFNATANTQAYSVATENELSEVLSHYSSEFVFSVVDMAMKKRFEELPLSTVPNAVSAWEQNFKTIIKNGVVMPQNHFCTNCGSKEFVEERLEKINFVDINFAVLKKTVVEACEPHVFTQCWEEKTNWQPKLLTQS